jgi:predicted dehydrogenase
MKHAPVRFAMIGAGSIAQSYAQACEKSQNARLVAIVDVRAEAARALAERCGCASYDSHHALPDGAKVEAVLVCTPPATHPEISLHFLDRRVHVLCEKPLSIDVASAERMAQTAAKAGVKLTMASKFRYVEDVVKAKSLMASGILGEIILFENAFTSRVDMSSRWNADPKVSGGGVLIDNGTHAVDLMRYFLGPLAAVQVIEGKRVQSLAVEDTVRIFGRSVGGVMASSDLSWSINKELDSYINIYGSQGTVAVGWKESRYRQSASPDWVVFGSGYDKVQALRDNIDNFARAVRGEDMLLVTAQDAIASVAVMEAAYRALRQDHWIDVQTGAPPATQRNGRKALAAGRVR